MNKIKKMKIGEKWIGGSSPCFIIAEIGSNHNQNLSQGKKLIDAAYRAGVDAVKFQSFKVENWMSREMKHFPTMKNNGRLEKTLKKCELTLDLYKKFQSYAEKLGLVCFSSPSHITDIDALERVNIPLYKFGSVQITDLPTIEYAASKNKPMILSTGASTIKEIKEAVDVILSAGNKKIILLHCTVSYPTDFGQVNLNAMETLMKEFNFLVGYSDHTLDPIIIPVAAVARGARVYEKHITLSRKMSGPDHPFAIEPDELKILVNSIRNTEAAFGRSVKKVLEGEKEIIRMGRRSVIAKIDIPRGMKIKAEMITTKRPGYGIAPKYYQKLIGSEAKKNIKQDQIMTWNMIK